MSPNIWRLIILKISSRPFKKCVTNSPPCRIANRYATSSETRSRRPEAAVIVLAVAAGVFPVGTVAAAEEDEEADEASAFTALACS